MSQGVDRTVFENAYATGAPWDIGRPQSAFVDVADKVSGSILDVGCGTGDISLFFAARGHRVTGIDFLSEPIARAKRKAKERGLSANFLSMDALALEVLPEVFDSAIDCGLFHVFSDVQRQRYVAGLHTVIKPGGTLYLMCFSDEEPAGLGPRRVSRAELEQSFADGWQIEAILPRQVEVTPAFQSQFTPGGPKAWFAVIRRLKMAP